MKRILFILAALLVLAGQAKAQRYLPKMKGIELRGGFVGGFSKPMDYYVGAALSMSTKNANRWVFGAEYLHKNYDYKETRIPRELFTAEGGYYLKFLSDPSKTFFLSIGGSALAGYETSNRSEKRLFDGATLRNKDAFIYGGAVTLEAEAYLSDKIVLLLNARERALWGSSIGKFNFQFGVGLKVIIN